VRVGDLVMIKLESRLECMNSLPSPGNPGKCPCWFCHNNSSGIGTVIEECPDIYVNADGLHVHSMEWVVNFDAGIYEVYENEVEILNE
jgi:hypothetical protein